MCYLPEEIVMEKIIGIIPHRGEISLTRRNLLKGAAILTGVIASGSPLTLLTPSRAWALETKKLVQVEADTIMAMGKALYPHKGLPDAVYALLVRDIDVKSAESADAQSLISEGVKALNAKSDNNNFVALPYEQQVVVLKSFESHPFFALVRGQCITSLYDNELAYAHFGYGGEVWSKGGYIAHGFNDLKWLPNPPEEASPSIS